MQEAFQDGVIENQIDVEVIPINGDSLLAAKEGETFAKLQEKVLELVDQCFFQVGLQVAR